MPKNLDVQSFDDHAERWLAGALLISQDIQGNRAVDQLGDLETIDLLNERCRHVVRVSRDKADAGLPCDAVIVAETLERECCVSPAWLSMGDCIADLMSMMDDTPSLWHVREWAERIQSMAVRRRALTDAKELLKEISQPRINQEDIAAAAERLAALVRSGKTSQPESKITTLQESAEKRMETRQTHGEQTVETGIPDLDHAIGGGAEFGEMFVLASRPSHGKTMCGLQMVHHWTSLGIPSAYLSEEMSAAALGKRAIQFASGVHQEHWQVKRQDLEQDVAIHFHGRSPCYIVENSRTAKAAANTIRKLSKEHGVKCVVVDYAQLLQSDGRSRYEQVTNTSITLRQVASETGVLLVVLCQLSRDVEKRKPLHPMLSDLKDSGQFEQDADVVVFLVWPHRMDSSADPKLYQFFVGKNRNREINSEIVTCRFEPSRQRITLAPVSEDTTYDYNFK